MGSIKKKRRKKMSKHKYDKRMTAQRHKNKYACVASYGKGASACGRRPPSVFLRDAVH